MVNITRVPQCYIIFRATQCHCHSAPTPSHGWAHNQARCKPEVIAVRCWHTAESLPAATNKLHSHLSWPCAAQDLMHCCHSMWLSDIEFNYMLLIMEGRAHAISFAPAYPRSFTQVRANVPTALPNWLQYVCEAFNLPFVPVYVCFSTPSDVRLVPFRTKSDAKFNGRRRTSGRKSWGDHTCSGFGVVPPYAPCQMMCLEAPMPASTDFVGSAFGMELVVGCSRTGLQPQKKAKVIVNPVTTGGPRRLQKLAG